MSRPKDRHIKEDASSLKTDKTSKVRFACNKHLSRTVARTFKSEELNKSLVQQIMESNRHLEDYEVRNYKIFEILEDDSLVECADSPYSVEFSTSNGYPELMGRTELKAIEWCLNKYELDVHCLQFKNPNVNAPFGIIWHRSAKFDKDLVILGSYDEWDGSVFERKNFAIMMLYLRLPAAVMKIMVSDPMVREWLKHCNPKQFVSEPRSRKPFDLDYYFEITSKQSGLSL